LEIILVDDGSPDRCGEICDAMATQDSRIRVIHKENGGLSSARNAGLDVMSGDYVGFVDSDDWIDAKMYGELYAFLKKTDTQVASCAIRCDTTSGDLIYYFCGKDTAHMSPCVFEGKEALKELIQAKLITNSVCDKLFRKTVFDERRFTVGIVNEDYEMMPKLIADAARIAYVPIAAYHYTMTQESITRGKFKESRFIEIAISRKHLAFYKKNFPDLYVYAAAKHIEIALVLIHLSASSQEFAERRNELIREVKSMVGYSVFACMNRKAQFRCLSFMISVRLYTMLMNLFYRVKR
jgi:glycosyltransferase involved in cell wall biosynthesis